MAHETDILLGGEAFIDRIVREDGGFAEKILLKIKDIGRAFSRMTDKDARAQYDRVKRAEGLYYAAIERRGWKYVNGAIQEKDEPEVIHYSRMNDFSFERNVQDILTMSDADAEKNKQEGNFIQVAEHTPAVIRENVAEAEDLPIIIRFDALYLAARHDGVLQGHYHNLGQEIMPRLPDILEHPDAVVKMKNGRLTVYAQINSAKGNNGIVSVELNTVKDINTRNDKYNMVVTMIPAKDNYTRNTLLEHGESVAYEKEDLSQVNPQLHEWLATINDKSSTDSISQNSDLSTRKTNFNRKDAANQQTSEDIDELMRSAGIEGDAVEIREDLAELYRKAENLATDEDATSGKAFVERVAKRIAGNMARLGIVRDGETQETMAERLREEILSRSAFAEQKAEESTKDADKEPKPKKTGYTYDDVHGMMDAVKKGQKFETAGTKSPKGTIFPYALFLYAKLYKMQILYN